MQVAPIALSLVSFLSFAEAASAQSINIDYGSAFGTPSAAYGGAAGQPGVWNALDGNSPPSKLVDVSGKKTRVFVHEQIPFGPAGFDDIDTTGDDQALMDDYLDLHSIPHTFVITGLQPGFYSIYTYGWAPDSAQFKTVVDVNGLGVQQVGGKWPGSHQQGVTFARHDLFVKKNGRVQIFTFGITKGTLNGMQIVRLDLAPALPKLPTVSPKPEPPTQITDPPHVLSQRRPRTHSTATLQQGRKNLRAV